MTLKPTRMETAAVVVIALQLGLAAFTATQGTLGPVALHTSADWTVDRWGDRYDAAWIIAGMAGLSALIAAAISFSLRSGEPDRARKRGLNLGLGVTLAALSLFCLLPAAQARPEFDPALGSRMAGSVICLVMALIGAFLGKIPPNALIGVRTPWSLTSRLAWDRSNRLAGRLFFWAGLIALPILPFVPPKAGMTAVTTGVLLIAVYVVFESWRVWRTDPDRRVV